MPENHYFVFILYISYMNNIYETKLAEYLNLATINPDNDDIKYKIIKYEQKLNQIGGANISKPIFVLFNGYGSSDLWFKYQYVSKIKLKKLSFYDELKKLGDVHTFNLKFFNINYYSINHNKKEANKWKKIFEKYSPHTSDIDFNLNDLNFDVICKQVYDDLTNKFDLTKRKLVIIGHSYGAEIAIHFAKMYTKHCLFCVCLDGSAHSLDVIKSNFNKHETKHEKMIETKFSDDTKLHHILDKIKENYKKNDTINKEIDLIYKLIGYKWAEYRMNNFIKKLPVPTLFFRALHIDEPKFKNYHKNWNNWAKQEQDDITKNNPSTHYKFTFYLNAHHYLWYDEKISADIILQIMHYMHSYACNA